MKHIISLTIILVFATAVFADIARPDGTTPSARYFGWHFGNPTCSTVMSGPVIL